LDHGAAGGDPAAPLLIAPAPRLASREICRATGSLPVPLSPSIDRLAQACRGSRERSWRAVPFSTVTMTPAGHQ